MPETFDCTFTSQWDGGTLVTTPAKVDAETGRVVSIEISDADVEGLDHLDGEYLTLTDGSEHAVEAGDDGRYAVSDVDAFLASVNGAPKP